MSGRHTTTISLSDHDHINRRMSCYARNHEDGWMIEVMAVDVWM